MTFASSNYPAPPGQDVLQDRQWRLRHSAWLLAPLLGCGMGTFVGFVYIAARMRSRKYWVIAAVYSALTVVVFAIFAATEGDTDSALSDLGGVLAIGLWLGGIVHGLILNREYLRWRAAATPWYANRTPTQPAHHIPAPSAPPTPAHPMALGTADFVAPRPPAAILPPSAPSPQPAAQPAAAALVDVNTADEAALSRVPGLSPDWAAHIITVRRSRNGFAGLDDFATAVGMQPHHLMRVRNNLTCSDGGRERSSGPHTAPPSRGRVLDI